MFLSVLKVLKLNFYYLQFCSKRGAYLFMSLWHRRHTLINEVDASTPPPPPHEMDAMPRLQGYIYRFSLVKMNNGDIITIIIIITLRYLPGLSQKQLMMLWRHRRHKFQVFKRKLFIFTPWRKVKKINNSIFCISIKLFSHVTDPTRYKINLI